MFGFTGGECMWKVNKAGFFIFCSLAREIPVLRSNSARLTLSGLNFSPISLFISLRACAVISVKSLCFSPIVISTDALAYIILEHERENTMAFSIRLKMFNSKRL